MSLWPLALAVGLGVAAGTCLAAEPQPTGEPAAVSAPVDHDLSLDLTLGGVSPDGSDAAPVETGPDQLELAAAERRDRRLDLYLGRAQRAGRSPGDAPPLYGEVGFDVDPKARLSLVPSIGVVLDDGERDDARAVAAQILKLGARIRF